MNSCWIFVEIWTIFRKNWQRTSFFWQTNIHTYLILTLSELKFNFLQLLFLHFFPIKASLRSYVEFLLNFCWNLDHFSLKNLQEHNFLGKKWSKFQQKLNITPKWGFNRKKVYEQKLKEIEFKFRKCQYWVCMYVSLSKKLWSLSIFGEKMVQISTKIQQNSVTRL